MVDSYVTGANGFIGSKLMAKLSFQPRNWFTEALSHRDLSQYMLHLEPYRRFFFLSAYGNMAQHDLISEMLSANVGDLRRVLSYTLGGGYAQEVESFLYASSSSVTLPVQTPYSRTKRAAEEMLQATNLPYCIVRPYSVTGVGEQKEHLIPKLIEAAFTGEPIPFYPYAIHDWVDVDDVVDGMLMLADQKRVGIFELGRGEPVSNAYVKYLVERATGKDIKTIPMDGRSYDTSKWYCQNPAEGWTPKKSLEESILEMVDAWVDEAVHP